MIIGSISENIKFEKRVAITPDIVKKYKSLGLDVQLSKDYALHLGIKDKEFEEEEQKFLIKKNYLSFRCTFANEHFIRRRFE